MNFKVPVSKSYDKEDSFFLPKTPMGSSINDVMWQLVVGGWREPGVEGYSLHDQA